MNHSDPSEATSSSTPASELSVSTVEPAPTATPPAAVEPAVAPPASAPAPAPATPEPKRRVRKPAAPKAATPAVTATATVTAAAPKAVVKRAAPVKPAPAPLAAPAKVADKVGKAKQKLVRDSFTMPRADFDLIDVLKKRMLELQRPTKKSELLRAGLQALNVLAPQDLAAALGRLAQLKPGRPRKES